MPVFFTKARLTPDQLARWDWAMAEYERIQRANVDAMVAAMSDEDKAALIMRARAQNPLDRRSVADLVRAVQNANAEGGGAAKSALFYRLLDGKTPLPHKPPTSMSYPWYSVIEESGPFQVTVSSVLNFRQGQLDTAKISINQCDWTIVGANAAAKKLLSLEAALLFGPSSSLQKMQRRAAKWDEGFHAEVIAAYADRPTIEVQFGQWPVYRLAINTHTLWTDELVAGDLLERNRMRDYHYFSGSVFDTQKMKLNLRTQENSGNQMIESMPEDSTQLFYDDWFLIKGA